VNRCLIDQQIVSGAYDTSVANLQTSSRGLAAIEYLLFYTGADNGCPATDPINAMGTWAAIPPIVLSIRKANYAHSLAADLVVRARDLNAAWTPNGFYTQLVTAGRGSTVFDTQQFAISSVAEAAFYVDTDVYNLRLGRALGHVVCTTGTCPEMLESQWADRGKQHLRNNLAGLRQLLQGCSAGVDRDGSPLGFDDMLTAAGAPSLATEMNRDLDNIAATIDAIPGDSLKAALSQNPGSLEAVHGAYGELVSFLKMEFSTTLQIQSQRVEGDAD
jgi:predicted lipoprotein